MDFLDGYKCVLVAARCGCVISFALVVYISAAFSGAVMLRSQSNNRPESGSRVDEYNCFLISLFLFPAYGLPGL
jgi:hypothetical protein